MVDEVTPGCEWVTAGEGVATFKWDGTCCLVRDGVLFKRRAVNPGAEWPADYTESERDEVTGKSFGWVPVGDGPDDRLHREAFATFELPEGSRWAVTCELIGPNVNGNRHKLTAHVLVVHGVTLPDAPRTFDALRDYCAAQPATFEGIVWHHPDGRMVKIKARDFPKAG